VGLRPLTEDALVGPLSRVADVETVPFPGAEFAQAIRREPELIVVDLAYLDEDVIRPLISRRSVSAGSTVVYLSDAGAEFDDLREARSGVMADASVASLVRLAAGERVEPAPCRCVSAERPPMETAAACPLTAGVQLTGPVAPRPGQTPQGGAEMLDTIMMRVQMLRESEEGQGLVEYALILALVSVVAIAALTALGTNISTLLQGVADTIAGA
jgi:pilus assembly protein Flp/PilA